MNVGTQLQMLRAAHRFSQHELGLRAGVDQRTVSRLERGQRRGRAGTWRRLARVLPDLGVTHMGTTEGLRAAADRRRNLARAYEAKAGRLREEAQKISAVATRLERAGQPSRERCDEGKQR